MESVARVVVVLAFLLWGISSSTSQSYRKELRTKNVISQNVIKQVDSSTETTKVDPSRVIQLSWQPRVFLYKGFLSDEECDHLISLAHGNLEMPLDKPRSFASSNQSTTLLTSLREEQEHMRATIKKLQKKRLGPFSVFCAIDDNAFEVSSSDELHMHFIFNVKDLSPFHGDNVRSFSWRQCTTVVLAYDPTQYTPTTDKDDIVARIEDRVSAWTFLPKVNSEPFHIMHFANENTKDALDYKGDDARVEASEPLLATVILYLSNVTYGGETVFMKSESKNTQLKAGTWSDCAKTGFSVKPIKGNALLFFSLRPNTGRDESSSSAGCPVLQGEKWCATKIFHLRPLEAKKTLLDSESDDYCTDEEDSCPQWAALGECEKNPVYMKGTPDYSGSCRKSCNAC